MKPGDFLLGLLDFFAIVLPGSLATWLATQYLSAGTVRTALSFGIEGASTVPDSVIGGTALFLASYVLGHFVFMAGSRLDTSYDRWRVRAKLNSEDKTYQAAHSLREELTEPLAGADFSLLKWAKVYVQIQAPEARLEIDRLEADSKFFRSMVIVSAAFAAHFLLHERAPGAGVAAIVLTVLSYRRFRDRRWTMTELSYATAVIVHKTKSSAEAGKTKTVTPTDSQVIPVN